MKAAELLFDNLVSVAGNAPVCSGGLYQEKGNLFIGAVGLGDLACGFGQTVVVAVHVFSLVAMDEFFEIGDCVGAGP